MSHSLIRLPHRFLCHFRYSMGLPADERRGPLDEVLGFLQTSAGDLANLLDHGDLVDTNLPVAEIIGSARTDLEEG